mmetsp:Transcript_8131/g.23873  ORF Transcript_8131/g.23873 Transcript_8131/m.23873 type:complete len:214 (-) Transcript_8131:678-1319(-)
MQPKTSPGCTATGGLRLCGGTSGCRDQLWTSCCGGALKPILKWSSWSRAKASPHAPTRTLAPRHLQTVGYKPGLSDGLRRVKPARGSPSNVVMAPSTLTAKKIPSGVCRTGWLPKTRQFVASSCGSRLVAVRSLFKIMQWSCSLSVNHEKPGASPPHPRSCAPGTARGRSNADRSRRSRRLSTVRLASVICSSIGPANLTHMPSPTARWTPSR